MSGFIEGESRQQVNLFPESLEDYISEENAVRVIDVFVDSLDLFRFGFKTESKSTGRPGYRPSTMLKLFIYGYLNRIQSSRRLEQESKRNLELFWLLQKLQPDFKTIADFRKDYGNGIRLVCKQFVILCRNMDLFADTEVAIDGSRFRAVNNRDKCFSKGKLEKRLEHLDQCIKNYLDKIEEYDSQEDEVAVAQTTRWKSKIEFLEKEIESLKELRTEIARSPDNQVSITDPDARVMRTDGRGTAMVGYNVQSAVDTKNHLIVAQKVTNVGNDRAQLSTMAKKAKETLQVDELTAYADRGYYKLEEIEECARTNIKAYVPKCLTSGNKARGLFDKSAFIYNAEKDVYRCPGGKDLIYRCTSHERGNSVRRYWYSNCNGCSIKEQCTVGLHRRVSRYENEHVLDEMEDRVRRMPDCMNVRARTVEHPFGTIKSWLGPTHFLMKTKKHVSTEMSVHVLAYNMKRVIKIMGTKKLMEAMAA